MTTAQLLRPLLPRQLAIAVAALAVIFVGEIFLGAAAAPRLFGFAFGAFMGIVATLVTARGVVQSSRAAARNVSLAAAPALASLVWKFVIMAGGAYFAFARLHLPPFFVIIGYCAMHAGFIWYAFGLRATEPSGRQSRRD